jgi:electron transfer flavoprotein beta subunit
MKIAVCVKAVPDAATGRRIDPSTKRLDRSGELTLSDYDTHPVEEALRLKDAAGDGEVVVVSMGPERAMDALRKALAMGADRAVLVSDEALEGADLVGTSKALAGALEIGYDTIRAPLPAVLAVSDAINEPRYPSLKGIMGAKRKPQDTLAAGDVGGAAPAATSVLALNPPPPRGDSRRVEDDGNAAEAIVEFLAEKRLL